MVRSGSPLLATRIPMMRTRARSSIAPHTESSRCGKERRAILIQACDWNRNARFPHLRLATQALPDMGMARRLDLLLTIQV